MSDDEQLDPGFEQSREFKQSTQNKCAICSTQASALRKNGFVVIKGRPCRLVEISSSAQESHLEGSDIFTGKKYETTVAEDANMDVPNVSREQHAFVSLLDSL